MNGSLKSRHRGQEHVMKFERLPSKTGQSESGEELHAVNHGKRDAAETGLTASDSIESSGVRRFASAGREKRAMRPQLRSDSEICSFYDISGGHSTRQLIIVTKP